MLGFITSNWDLYWLKSNKSFLYTLTILVICWLLAYENINVSRPDKGIGLYGGLFHATPTSHTFHMFIYLISATILQLTGFYPRKVWIKEYSSIFKLLF